MTQVFAWKRSAFLQIANVRGKQVKNNAKYFSSTTRILYETQVLTHAKRFEKPDKVDWNLLQASHQTVLKRSG